MEIDLKNLIEKIKKDGVEQAQTDASDIIKKAQEQADSIIEQAKQESQQLLIAAKKEADQYNQASIKSLGQASRDVLLNLRKRAQEFLARVVKEEVQKKLSTEVVQEAILKITENFSKDKGVDVILSEKDKEGLQKSFLNELKRRNAEIKTSMKIEKGFRIGDKGANIFYEFTDEALTEAFMGF